MIYSPLQASCEDVERSRHCSRWQHKRRWTIHRADHSGKCEANRSSDAGGDIRTNLAYYQRWQCIRCYSDHKLRVNFWYDFAETTRKVIKTFKFSSLLTNFLSFCDSELPLVLYVFSKDSKIQELFCKHTRSGSMCINDTVMQYVGKEMWFENCSKTMH